MLLKPSFVRSNSMKRSLASLLPKSGRRLRSTALIIKLALDKTIIAQTLNAAPTSEMRYI